MVQANMESQVSVEASKPFYMRKNFIALVVVLAISLIVFYIVYTLITTPASSPITSSLTLPWLFKGAYTVVL
jgi:uncharacterized protein HemY